MGALHPYHTKYLARCIIMAMAQENKKVRPAGFSNHVVEENAGRNETRAKRHFTPRDGRSGEDETLHDGVDDIDQTTPVT